MSKDIKDYLHLYLGCECLVVEAGKETDWENTEQSQQTVSTQVLEQVMDWNLDVRLLLRPLSKMTQLEQAEWWDKTHHLGKPTETREAEITGENTVWLLSKHFDLFGLIEAGLAIDKTKINSKEEQERSVATKLNQGTEPS